MLQCRMGLRAVSSGLAFTSVLAVSGVLYASPEMPTEYAASDQEPAPEVSTVDNEAKAKELFLEGRRLTHEALYGQACPLFEQSLKLSDRASTQFNLAECWERLGRLASAHRLYLDVAQVMHDSDDREREKVARRRAELLENRLCGLSIEPTRAEKNMEIQVGTQNWEPARWGAAFPVDPGTYTVRAAAPGMKPWSTEVEVEACPTLVSVLVPRLESEKVASLEPVPTRSVSRTLREPATSAEEGWTPPVLPMVIAGVGIGALGVGAVFLGEYQSKNDDAGAVCPQATGCTRAQVDLHAELVSEAKTARTWTYVGFGVGGAALASAAILYFAGNYDDPSTQRGWRVSPLTAGGYDTWGAALGKNF